MSYKLLTSVHEGLFLGAPASFLCIWQEGRHGFAHLSRDRRVECALLCVYRETDLHLSCSEVFPKAPRRSRGQEGAGQEGGGSLAPLLKPDLDRSVSQVPLSRKKGFLVLRHWVHNLLPKRRLSSEYRAPGFQCFLQ